MPLIQRLRPGRRRAHSKEPTRPARRRRRTMKTPIRTSTTSANAPAAVQTGCPIMRSGPRSILDIREVREVHGLGQHIADWSVLGPVPRGIGRHSDGVMAHRAEAAGHRDLEGLPIDGHDAHGAATHDRQNRLAPRQDSELAIGQRDRELPGLAAPGLSPGAGDDLDSQRPGHVRPPCSRPPDARDPRCRRC